jgi:hypothetical protein
MGYVPERDYIFTHKRFAYPFEIRDASDWMAKHFLPAV